MELMQTTFAWAVGGFFLWMAMPAARSWWQALLMTVIAGPLVWIVATLIRAKHKGSPS